MSGLLSFLKGEPKQEISFDQVYDQRYQAIFNYVLGRTGRVADAEDLTAQTFFQALRHFHKMNTKPMTEITPWLYRIATNEVNGWLRKGKGSHLREVLAPDEQLQQIQDGELTQAEEQLAQNRIFGQLHAVLAELKPEEQTLIALRYFEQQSFRQISAILQKREGTLVMRTHRALEKLKTELQKRGISHERFRDCLRESPADYRAAELPAQSAP
jgi:RNA polymerase sigma-70 factor (ECF subfamily)